MVTHAIADREAPPHRGGFLKSIAFHSNLAQSSKYRADIDGLRAIAVLSVVFFHAKILQCKGGYVGVDVFFVISGYLVTSLIVKDVTEGKFSFVTFYERRVRRIFPALFAVLFFCVLAGCLIFAPEELGIFGKTLTATTFFASNIEFWRHSSGLGYFNRTSEFQVLLHTWSLSVEEQFYLVFPTVLLVLSRWAKKRINLCILILAVMSFGLSLWATAHRPFAAFYLSVPRAWELLTGALLATGFVPSLRSRVVRELAGLAGLSMIVAAVFTLTAATPFPGYAALLPCLGTGLIIWAGEQGDSTTKLALSFRPLVFIGVISYSLYLWHWPLLVFSRYFFLKADDLTGGETAVVLASSGILAFLSFEFVERPFRGSASRFTRRQVFTLGLAASAASVVIGSAVYLSHGLPQRYGKLTRQVIEENMNRRQDYDDRCANWLTDVHKMADIQFCAVGNQSSKKIMFWGDSHVGQLLPVVRTMYAGGDLKGEGALFAIEAGCLPAEHLNSLGGYHCDSFAKLAMARAEETDIDTVFIAFNTWWTTHGDAVCASVDGRCTKTLSPEESGQLFLKDLADEVSALRSAGKRVIICLPFPMYDKSIPELEMRNAVFGRFGLVGHATDVTSPAMSEDIRTTAIGAGARVFDPRAILCPGGKCITQVGGVSVYADNHHLAGSEVGIFRESLAQVLR